MIKYLIFLLNFIFLLTGCVLVAAGAYVQSQMKEYFDFLGNVFRTVITCRVLPSMTRCPSFQVVRT